MSAKDNLAETLADAQASFMSALTATLAATKLGVQIAGAEVRTIKAGISQKVSTSKGRLVGFSLRETTGAASATIYLRDGNDNSGDIIAAIQLAPGESAREYYQYGLAFGYGVFLDVAAGAVEGAVYVNGSAD